MPGEMGEHVAYGYHWIPKKRDGRGNIVYKANIPCVKCGVEREVAKSYFLESIITKKVSNMCVDCAHKESNERLNERRESGEIITPSRNDHRIQRGYRYIKITEGDPMWEMAYQKYYPIGRDAWGYIAEHRYRMADKEGRPLETWEIVHHKDANKLNNEVSNLYLTSGREHFELTLLQNENRKLRDRIAELEGKSDG